MEEGKALCRSRLYRNLGKAALGAKEVFTALLLMEMDALCCPAGDHTLLRLSCKSAE